MSGLQPLQRFTSGNVRFACRILGMITANSSGLTRNQQPVAADCFYRAPNALKQQSKPLRDATLLQSFSLSPYEQASHTYFCKRGAPHGWGIAGLHDHGQQDVFRQPVSAAGDTLFDTASQDIIRHRPDVLLGHLRVTEGIIRPENTHPFTCGPWNLIHNGNVSVPPLQRLRSQQDGAVPFTPPQGDTDSEAALHFFVNNLWTRFKTLETKVIGPERVLTVFRESIAALVEQEPVASRNPQQGPDLSEQTLLHGKPTCNFIVSDGSMLLASRRGPTLFIGHTPDRSLYLVASEPIQPTGRKIPKLNWQLIPDKSTVMLTKPAGRKKAVDVRVCSDADV